MAERTGYKIIVYLDDNPNSATYMQTYTERVEDLADCPVSDDDLVLVSNECEVTLTGRTGYRLLIYYNKSTGEYIQERELDPECIPSSTEEEWVASGSPFCETVDGLNTGYMLQLEVQKNIELPNYGETRYRRWKSPECGSNDCADWDEVSRQCHVTVNNCVATFDGTADVTQIDINQLSETYGQTRTINVQDSNCENCTDTTFSWVEVGTMCGDADLLCENGIQQTSTNKYTVSRKYKTIGTGTPIPMDEYQVVLYEEDSEDCGYIAPMYRWDKTDGYLCDYETHTKYEMYVKMVSYDSGATWGQVVPIETQRGDVIAYDSYDCGMPMYRWIETGEYVCVDNGDDYKIALVDISGTAISSVSCSDATVTSTDYNAVRGYSYSVDDCWYYGLYEIGDCVDTIDGNALRDIHQDATHQHFIVKMGDYVTTIEGYGLDTIGMCSIEGNPYNDKKPLKLSRNLRYVGVYPFGGDYVYSNTSKYIQFQTDNPPELIGSGASGKNQNIKLCVVPYGSLFRYHDAAYLGIPDSVLIQEPVLSERTDYKFKLRTSSGTTYYFGDDGYNTISNYDITQALKTIRYHIGGSTLPSASISFTIEFGENITSIGDSAFTNTSLLDITIPSSITSIGNMAFYNSTTTAVTGITCISTTPPTLGPGAFNGTRGCDIFVPCESREVYMTTSSWSDYVGRIVGLPPCEPLPSRFTAYYYSGFSKYNQYCMSSTSTTLSSGETRNNGYAHSAMTSAEVGDCITDIGTYAFSYCTNLTSVTISNSVTSIGSYAFQYSMKLKRCNIGSGVTTIGAGAFDNCRGLTSIVIPNGVTSIGDSTFNACSGLTSVGPVGSSASVEIPNSVTTIGNSAFDSCRGLRTVVIPDNVTTIDKEAFEYCSSLTSCTIGSGITSISGDAFYGCSGLTSLTIKATTPPSLGWRALRGTSNNLIIYVPAGSVESYKSASDWSDYSDRIQPITS